MRTSNSSAYGMVMAKEKFTASNMWGEWIKVVTNWGEPVENDLYVVYSYGRHFPMWVWDTKLGAWLGNSDKYSRSTTRQQSQTRPSQIHTWLDTEEIKRVVMHGGLSNYTIEKARV